MYISEKSVEVAFSAKSGNCNGLRTGLEPSLGGALREKAVWVDESDCIGCRYCAHVASNTFVMVPETGRCRAVRQDGDLNCMVECKIQLTTSNAFKFNDVKLHRSMSAERGQES